LAGATNPQDSEKLAKIISKTGKLEFRLVDTTSSSEDAPRRRIRREDDLLYQTVGSEKRPMLVKKQALVDGADLIDAQAIFDSLTREPMVTFKFNGAGARKFALATQENVDRSFAIVLDNDVLSAPIIREPILGGSGQIQGGFTVESANNMAVLLRAGALPV